jgi:hypothetical protein
MGLQQDPCNRAVIGMLGIASKNASEQLELPFVLRYSNRSTMAGSTGCPAPTSPVDPTTAETMIRPAKTILRRDRDGLRKDLDELLISSFPFARISRNQIARV